MDVEWAASELETHLGLCQQVNDAAVSGGYWNDRAAPLNHRAELTFSTIAKGALAGIRIVSAHGDVRWCAHIAIENLSVLSAVVRWADETVEVGV